ncbi:MAG: hypothetical protein GTN80_11670, partial [Nitrososphaeria archaeon]|nr:hypothetical protein [Nitrososphaeria archaeon]
MIDSFGLILQTLIVPAVASPIALLMGRRLKAKTGWLVFAAMLYPTIIYGFISTSIFLGTIDSSLKASYFWGSILDRFSLL